MVSSGIVEDTAVDVAVVGDVTEVWVCVTVVVVVVVGDVVVRVVAVVDLVVDAVVGVVDTVVLVVDAVVWVVLPLLSVAEDCTVVFSACVVPEEVAAGPLSSLLSVVFSPPPPAEISVSDAVVFVPAVVHTAVSVVTVTEAGGSEVVASVPETGGSVVICTPSASVRTAVG